MKNYQWILFDADETLFHFDAFSGLQRMFSSLGVQFTQQDFQEYQTINIPLWVSYQNGTITAQQLQHRRFNNWANKLQLSTQELNNAFLTAMIDICAPIKGAINLLNFLKGKAKLGIITNGFTELQQVRLERMGLQNHFHFVVVSEQVGVAKPHPAIFEHALSLMDNPVREHVLMVGDNPDSDILGGINAGLDTCWVNIEKKAVPEGIIPNYQVSSLKELENLLAGRL